jgi:DNA-binding NarL/FixJ family response regulator
LSAEGDDAMPHLILIADDHPLTCEGLAMAARLAVPGAVVHFAGTIAEAEQRITAHGPYQLILLDLMLPDATGFSGLLRLQFASPDTRIAIITARQELALAAQSRELGAVAFLRKSEPIDTLAGQIRTVVGGVSVFPPDLPGARSTMRDRIGQLSDAQRRVLFALADGRSNKQIAHDLGITEATVKAHLTAIFRGLDVYNRAQALVALQPLLGAISDDMGASRA